jgi:hypothetical protein
MEQPFTSPSQFLRISREIGKLGNEMTLIAAVGQAQVTDAREAGLQAAYQALNSLGTVLPSLCLVIVPYRYDPQQVINGAVNILPNVPILAFGVSSGMTQTGVNSHAVIVAILAGDSLEAETHWFPAYRDLLKKSSGEEIASQSTHLLGIEQPLAKHVLVFADGLDTSEDTDAFCNSLPVGLSVLGGVSSGNLLNATNHFQVVGTQAGVGNLAAAFLRGDFKIGLGYGHGWHAVGNPVRLTSTGGFWLRTLDGSPASKTYAHLFGQTNLAWTLPPLSTLSRIYPLGCKQDESAELLVRAPIRVETDGSLRMTSVLPEGGQAYLMVGNPADCLRAASQAAQQALLELGESKPVFALVLVDTAWQMLLQTQPGLEIQAVQEVLGPAVPIAGGYTLGQILPPRGENMRSRFLNQHIVVAVFSDL